MGKYLKLFETHAEYEAYIQTDFDKPNVSHCEDQDDVHYNPIPDPYSGHEYVDLGLSSGTLWATMNVGASDITDYGNYYMYGMGSKTYDNTDTPYAGDEDPLPTSADTAAQEWGGEWHTPTRTQVQELTASTTYQWVTDYQGSGINGALFTAQNGNSIFLPAAGHWYNNSHSDANIGGGYWCSTPAYLLGFDNEGKGIGNRDRDYGWSIRPVVG